MDENLAGLRVRAVAPDGLVPHAYLVFADGRLWRARPGSTRAEFVVDVPGVREVGDGTGDGRLQGKELEIRLYVHGPWVCATERFGVNASLINTTTGVVRGLRRADYHSDVSSFSAAFLDRDGRTLLVLQTRWNRLDVLDAETGVNLTERDETTDIDYFHSLLHVAPGSRHFLSNGWVWSPVDMVRVFSTEAFLTGYEATSLPVAEAFGYNWDRPCAFIDERTFVLVLDEEESGADPYRQLAFFEIPDPFTADEADRWLESRSQVDCDVFRRNQYGEVKGELHYDPASGHLVALTAGDGCYLISVDGDVVAHAPDLSVASPPSHGDMGSRYSGAGGWSYAPQRRLLYRWTDRAGIEEHALPQGSGTGAA